MHSKNIYGPYAQKKVLEHGSTKVSLFTEGVGHGRRAGLIIFREDYATLSLTRNKKGFIIKQTTALEANDGKEEKTLATKRISIPTEKTM